MATVTVVAAGGRGKALISVSDKAGLVDLAKVCYLHEFLLPVLLIGKDNGFPCPNASLRYLL
jgi:hypothetical protein